MCYEQIIKDILSDAQQHFKVYNKHDQLSKLIPKSKYFEDFLPVTYV